MLGAYHSSTPKQCLVSLINQSAEMSDTIKEWHFSFQVYDAIKMKLNFSHVGTCGYLRLVTEGVLISVMHVSTGAVNARGSENTFPHNQPIWADVLYCLSKKISVMYS